MGRVSRVLAHVRLGRGVVGIKCSPIDAQVDGTRRTAGTASNVREGLPTGLPLVTHFGGNLTARVVEVRGAGTDHVLLIQQVADVHR